MFAHDAANSDNNNVAMSTISEKLFQTNSL